MQKEKSQYEEMFKMQSRVLLFQGLPEKKLECTQKVLYKKSCLVTILEPLQNHFETISKPQSPLNRFSFSARQLQKVSIFRFLRCVRAIWNISDSSHSWGELGLVKLKSRSCSCPSSIVRSWSCPSWSCHPRPQSQHRCTLSPCVRSYV